MSAQHPLGPSPEHFELMRAALDHIARAARNSRSMTRRLRWIEQRAEFAIRGEVYSDDKVNLPKSAGPDTPEKLQKRLSAMTVERDKLQAVLEIIASGNTDPDRMVEIASAAIAKANGQEGGAL